MRLLTLKLQNFMGFGPAQELSLANRGLVAIFGRNRDAAEATSNGSGKSTIFEAIVWVLFGKTLRRLPANGVVNRFAGKNCEVSLTIEDDDKRHWRIVRTRQVSAKKENDLQLFSINEDGDLPATAGTNDDTQELIETLLGLTYDTFVQAVLMTHGEVPFTELTDAPRKAALEDILRVSLLSRAREAAVTRIRDVESRLALASSDESRAQHDLKTMRIRLAEADENKEAHADVLAGKKAELRRRRAQVEAQAEDCLYSSGLDKLLDDQADMDHQLAQLREKEISLIRESEQAFRVALETRTELEKKKSALLAIRNQHDQTCERVEGLMGKPCPTCGFVVNPQDADHLIVEWDKAIAQSDEQIAGLDQHISKLRAGEDKLRASTTANANLVRQEIANLTARAREHHAKIQRRASSLQLICQLEQQSFLLAEEVSRLDDETNPYVTIAAQAQKDMQGAEERYRRANTRKRVLESELKHLRFWDKGFGNRGLKSLVIENALPFLQERAQQYADVLSGGDIQIVFSATKENKDGVSKDEFDIRVVNRHGAEIYRGNSDGEKRRINTAIAWALADLAAARAQRPIRFRGLDEPFENLDEVGENAVVKLLHSAIGRYETILCVTHSDHMRDQFTGSITVVRENDNARFEE